MSLRVLEMKWKTALTSILEELTQPELRKLLYKLDKIPQGLTNEAPREKLPDMIIQHYGTEGSISAIDKEMKVLPRNDAKVQEPLRPFVEKVNQRKKQRQETKGQLTGCRPDTKKISQPSAQGSIERKMKLDPVGANKPKQKTVTQESLKPAESTNTPKIDPVGAKKPKQKTEKQESLKPAESTETPKMDPVVAKKPKQKTVKQESLKPAESTETPKMDPVGAKKPKQKTVKQESLKPAESTETPKMDPVGAKKPKQKTEKQESLKPAESTKTPKVPSKAVQTGRIKITGIKSFNKRNTHLEAEFNNRSQTFYVTTRILADAFGKEEDDFKEMFSFMMPLNAEAQMQGNKIIGIKK